MAFSSQIIQKQIAAAAHAHLDYPKSPTVYSNLFVLIITRLLMKQKIWL